jgi:hypothetical protein
MIDIVVETYSVSTRQLHPSARKWTKRSGAMAGRMPRSCCRTTTSCHESAPPVRLPRGQMKMIQTACAWQTTCGTRHISTTRTSRGVSVVLSKDAPGRSGGFFTCQRWGRMEQSSDSCRASSWPGGRQVLHYTGMSPDGSGVDNMLHGYFVAAR